MRLLGIPQISGASNASAKAWESMTTPVGTDGGQRRQQTGGSCRDAAMSGNEETGKRGNEARHGTGNMTTRCIVNIQDCVS